jgi:hypothetical protein
MPLMMRCDTQRYGSAAPDATPSGSEQMRPGILGAVQSCETACRKLREDCRPSKLKVQHASKSPRSRVTRCDAWLSQRQRRRVGRSAGCQQQQPGAVRIESEHDGGRFLVERDLPFSLLGRWLLSGP